MNYIFQQFSLSESSKLRGVDDSLSRYTHELFTPNLTLANSLSLKVIRKFSRKSHFMWMEALKGV